MAEREDSKYRVALDLARIIKISEIGEASLPDNPREYWLRLYNQCVLANSRNDIDEVVGLVKIPQSD